MSDLVKFMSNTKFHIYNDIYFLKDFFQDFSVGLLLDILYIHIYVLYILHIYIIYITYIYILHIYI